MIQKYNFKGDNSARKCQNECSRQAKQIFARQSDRLRFHLLDQTFRFNVPTMTGHLSNADRQPVDRFIDGRSTKEYCCRLRNGKKQIIPKLNDTRRIREHGKALEDVVANEIHIICAGNQDEIGNFVVCLHYQVNQLTVVLSQFVPDLLGGAVAIINDATLELLKTNCETCTHLNDKYVNEGPVE